MPEARAGVETRGGFAIDTTPLRQQSTAMLTKRTLTALSAVVLASLLSAATASAAYESYIKIKGSKQGQIKAAEARPSKTDAAAFHIESYRMVDAAGMPVGKRRHMPLVITKEVDSASPKLLSALSTNEALTELLIQSMDASTKGAPAITIQATNARVTSINHVGNDDRHPTLTKGKSYEEISFAYEKVQLTRSDKGTPEIDTWE
jgi:type VI secretion system secreted protein Hcp